MVLSTQFQFLLVQLKVYAICCKQTDRRISIPIGSIKRKQVLFTLKKTQKFQFLLVQLKDQKGSVSKRESQISIPIGSIKSQDL